MPTDVMPPPHTEPRTPAPQHATQHVTQPSFDAFFVADGIGCNYSVRCISGKFAGDNHVGWQQELNAASLSLQ